jgi:hypothetical protein
MILKFNRVNLKHMLRVAGGNDMHQVHVLCARSEMQDIFNLLTGDLCHCEVNGWCEGTEETTALKLAM